MSADERLASLKIDRPEPAPRRRWPWVVLLVLLIAGLGGGWVLFSRATLPEVRTATVREVRLDEATTTVLDASGYVVARRQATVSSKVTGRVLEVLIEEGTRVSEGQLLARLDDSNARVNLQLAQAEVGATRTQLEETRVRQREAERELSRRSTLLEREIISQAELDSAQAEVDSLRARLDQQTEQVKVAEARVALWEQEIADREIRAPFAGVVVTKNAQPGEMISPVSAGGGFTRTGIGTIVDMGSLEIEVDVNESYINRVREGQPVVATLDAYPDWEIPADVIAIVPTADRQRATVRVRIGFRELDPRILPDMGVKVAFRETEQVTEQRRGLQIPRAALRQLDGRNVVWVLDGDTLRLREVGIGEVRGETAEVASGLDAGERVVIEGPQQLTDGMRVRDVS